MLAYILAVLVGTGSVGLYAAAFLFPEVHRKHDFIWSGLGLFYALFLWIYAQQVTGGILVGQTTSVALLGWLAWQIFKLRRQVPPIAVQPTITPSTKPAATKTAAARPENRTAKTPKTASPGSATDTTTTASPGDRAAAAVKANPSRTNPSAAANPAARTARPAATTADRDRTAATARPPATANPNSARETFPEGNRAATAKPAATGNSNSTPASPQENRAANRSNVGAASPQENRAARAVGDASVKENRPAADPGVPTSPQPSTSDRTPPTAEPLPVTIEVAVEPKRQSPPPQHQNSTPTVKPVPPTDNIEVAVEPKRQSPTAQNPNPNSATNPVQPIDNEAWIKLETSKSPLGGAIQPPAKPPIADIPLPQSGDLDALLDEIETTVKQDVDRPQS